MFERNTGVPPRNVKEAGRAVERAYEQVKWSGLMGLAAAVLLFIWLLIKDFT